MPPHTDVLYDFFLSTESPLMFMFFYRKMHFVIFMKYFCNISEAISGLLSSNK